MEIGNKYKPDNIENCVNSHAVTKMCKWIEAWEAKINIDKTKNAVLLHGPSGTGKSLYAKLLLEKYKYNDVLYFSTNDVRTYSRLSRRIDKFINNFTFLTYTGVTVKRAIIFDELEGIGNSDKGCIKKILEIIYPKKAKCKQKITDVTKYKVPIICITNNINDPKSNKIKKYCNNIAFTLPNETHIKLLLKQIRKKTGKTIITPKLCIDISNKYKFDFNTLFRFIDSVDKYKQKMGIKKITKNDIKNFNFLSEDGDIVHSRYLNSDMYILSRKIMTEPITYKECFDYFNAFPSILQYIVYDNVNTYYTRDKNNIDDVIDNLDALSISNIIDKTIHDDQFWFLTDYTSVLYLKTANEICSRVRLPINEINFSSILNKNSKTLYTHKIIKELLRKINVNSYDLTLTGSIIIESFLKLKDDKTNLDWFKQTDIIGSIDKFSKFNLFEKEYNKAITNKYKKSILKLL